MEKHTMPIYEESGREVVCPICRDEFYHDCGHLVGDFDRTYCEYLGGSVVDHVEVFSSQIETAFLSHLRCGSESRLDLCQSFSELWDAAKKNYKPEQDELVFDGNIFQRVLIELLTEVGVQQPDGYLVDPGPPSFTSSVVLLFADSPSKVVDQAFRRLSERLGQASTDR